MELNLDKKILIVGLGLMGGSYAEALTRKGYCVGAVTRSRKSIEYALSKGMIASGTTEVTPGYVGKFDVVVFSLYPHLFVEWVKQYGFCFKPGAVLTDVTGVKGSVVPQIQSMLRPDVEFIAAHPMAGREVSGVENATAAIFEGANYIVTPTPANTPQAIALCRELGETIGCGRISVITPEEHDEMIGFLSQLTHCIAVSLMTCKDSEHLVDYSGDSFRDLTRIARINDEMWTELFLMNKKELLSQMDLFLKQFRQLREAVATDDKETLRSMMRLSTQRRMIFEKKETK